MVKTSTQQCDPELHVSGDNLHVGLQSDTAKQVLFKIGNTGEWTLVHRHKD